MQIGRPSSRFGPVCRLLLAFSLIASSAFAGSSGNINGGFSSGSGLSSPPPAPSPSPTPVPTPAPPAPNRDPEFTDSDNDGLTDAVELEVGSDPYNADSNGD